MKALLLAGLIGFMIPSSVPQNLEVYHCQNGNSKIYHIDRECHALKRCTYEVKKLSVEDARKQGWRLCGFED